MASADRVTLSYIEEVTYGTTPSGQHKDLRFTSESLRGVVTEVRSAEIRSDRQVADVMRTGLRAEGDINFEFSNKTFDDMLLYLLGATAWSSPVTVVNNTNIQAIATGDQLSASTGSPFASFAVGQWVRVTGFSNAANNGVFKISGASATTLNLDAAGLVDEAAGNQISVRMGAQIVNGTTLKTLTLQRKMADISRYLLYRGAGVNTLRMSGAVEQLVTGTFGMLAKREDESGTDAATSHTPADGGQGDGPLFSLIQPRSFLPIGLNNNADLPGALEMTEFDFTINGNLYQRQRIGELGAISQGGGKVEANGSFRAYYNSEELYTFVLNYVDLNVAVILEGDVKTNLIDNPIYVFEFPSCRLSPADGVVTPGENQDIFASVNFSAKRHPVEGVTVRITRIDPGTS